MFKVNTVFECFFITVYFVLTLFQYYGNVVLIVFVYWDYIFIRQNSFINVLGIYPLDRSKYPMKRFYPRVLKRYDLWCEMGKPEDIIEELATSINTAQKIKRPSTKDREPSISSLQANESTSATKESFYLSISNTSKTPNVSETKCECHLLDPRPHPCQIWVTKWVFDYEPSTFEEKVLNKVKGSIDEKVENLILKQR